MQSKNNTRDWLLNINVLSGWTMTDAQVLIFHVLFHNNLMILFGFRECFVNLYQLHWLGLFYAGNFPGNVSFRTEIASVFSISSMSNFLSNCYKEITEDIGHYLYPLIFPNSQWSWNLLHSLSLSFYVVFLYILSFHFAPSYCRVAAELFLWLFLGFHNI
jgi:hypothetical protein